jgi:hypothetical protein
MVRIARLLLALAFLAGASAGSAQTPLAAPLAAPAAPPAPAPAGTREPEFLRTLPRPPDEPRSLFQPPAPPGPPPADLPGPYFEHDPALDPHQMPQPGWFTDVQLAIVKPHVRNDLTGSVLLGTNSSFNALTGAPPTVDTVSLQSAPLNWTVAPRFEVGCRLPSGFGEVALAYRFLATQGSTLAPAPDGTARLSSRLNVNQLDLDYVSREWSLWPHWEMKWRVGLRLASVYFDSRADEPFDVAAAGSMVFEQRDSDSWRGIGPHAGLELRRKLDCDGQWSVFARADFATMLGRQRQGFFEVSTNAGPDGQPLTGSNRASGSQDVPIAHVEVGVSWQPYQEFFVFMGYQYEKWWDVGRLNLEGSHGYFYDHAIVLQAQLNF